MLLELELELELEVAFVVEVVVAVADLCDELRLKPIRAAAITITAIADVKMILFCLVIRSSRFVLPYLMPFYTRYRLPALPLPWFQKRIML